MTRDLVEWNLTADEAKMLNRRERTEFLDRLKASKTAQGQFEKSFLHLDQENPDGRSPCEASDGGKAAAEIRAACEEVPRWRHLWDRARNKLTRKQKRILDALLVDMRTTKAAELAGVSRRQIERFKKTFFKTHFSQCHRAWKRDFV